MRLNPDCDTYEEVEQYYKERSIQLILDDFTFFKIITYTGIGCIAVYTKNSRYYHSIYIYKSARGKNKYKKLLSEIEEPDIITSKSCDIESYLQKNNIQYTTCLEFQKNQEYIDICEYYDNLHAKRSGVHYMNHIDEGLAILHLFNCTEYAKLAYCLHPVYQDDVSLKNVNNTSYDNRVIMNVMEYRNVANAYLSSRSIDTLDEIKLSPLKDVNDMLIADKIQNYKDFELYHYGKHKRYKELDQYFKNWLEKLDITLHMYELIKTFI